VDRRCDGITRITGYLPRSPVGTREKLESCKMDFEIRPSLRGMKRREPWQPAKDLIKQAGQEI
jgi:hypothetical protein